MRKLMVWLLAILCWVLLVLVCIWQFDTEQSAQGLPQQGAQTASTTSLELLRTADDRWILSGTVPDEQTRQSLQERVQSRLDIKDVVNQLQIAENAEVPPQEFPLDLRGLIEPRLVWRKGQWTLAGQTRKPEQLEAFRKALPVEVKAHLDDQLIVDEDLDDRLLEKINGLVAKTDFTFVSGSAELTPSGRSQLDQVAKWLVQVGDLQVLISGHTDSHGIAARNLVLSQARADNVRSYLIGQGIAQDRLVAKGYGDTQPRESNSSAEGRAKNRRIEFRFN